MRKYKKVRFLTIILVSLWFLAISNYLDYGSLAEAVFLHDEFQFEVPALEDFLTDKQDFHCLSGQTPLPIPLEGVLFLFILAFFWQGILSDQKSFILRC